LHEILPAPVNVTLLADRRFGDQKLFMYRKTLGWSYAMRFWQTIHVTHRDHTMSDRDWVPLAHEMRNELGDPESELSVTRTS